METPRREKYYINMELDFKPERTAAGRQHNIRMYIINLRNRCLTFKNVESLIKFMPSLQGRLTGKPALSVTATANVRIDRLRNNFFYKGEDVENARYCPLLAKPAQVMMTPASFRPAAGRLLSPVHPDKAHIAVLKADQRNDILHVQQDNVSVHRVVSSLYSAAEEQMKGWFRVSDYEEDGQMSLSVMCYFPTERGVELDKPQKRQRVETFTQEKIPKSLRL